MNPRIVRRALRALLVLCSAFAAAAQPRIFFSDLQSGPNRGGERNQGVWVTVWGRGFGAARGGSTVTVGGGAAAAYPVWTDSRITFQLGAAAGTGEIVVHVPGAAASNGVPFTVRPGRIYFVSLRGRDGNPGSFGRPWATVTHAVHAPQLRAGDTIYLMDGVTAATDDAGYGAAVSIFDRGGTEAEPIALVAYPNATATLGRADGGPPMALRTPNIQLAADHWVISQLHLEGRGALVLGGLQPGVAGWRIVGNDMYCPYADRSGGDGCVEVDISSDTRFFGNTVHDVGVRTEATVSKMMHGVYFSTDANHVWVGWNTIRNVRACRGLLFHSSPNGQPGSGRAQYDLHVFSNTIENTRCDGIDFATVDPSKGAVEAYNNVVRHAGTGPDFGEEGSSDYACIYSAGATNQGAPGAGAVKVYNNTLIDCGSRLIANREGAMGAGGALNNGGGDRNLRIEAVNNIVYQRTGETYVDGATDLVRGDHNLWYGLGAGPLEPGGLAGDPAFVDAAAGDFHLRPGSAAIGAGAENGLAVDKDGVERPRARPDLGAYQHEEPAAK